MSSFHKFITKSFIYEGNNKLFKVIASKTGVSNIKDILCSCNCIPFNLKKNYKDIYYHNDWIAPFHTNLLFEEQINIHLNKLSIPNVNLDCYYNCKITDIMKISKYFYMKIGDEIEYNTKNINFCFLGLDNVVRGYTLVYNDLIQVSPFIWGIEFISSFLQKKHVSTNLMLEDCVNIQEYIILNSNYEKVQKLFQSLKLKI